MKVLIFDGDCSFCNFFVRFTVRINKNPELRITDFNTDWTKENHKPDDDIDSVIYIAEDKTYIYSDAALHMLADTNRLFKPVVLLKLIPKFIRDTIYKVIAKYRKKIPVKNVCERPSKKFIDMYLS
ncbi:DUF393 domain-containing protein [Jeotgalicoccus halotolerans]|uniref:thiol-disulfide oxidoreductase DCC family protein n=1 Tax=Jeotgalicoccus halotolerans TaxID=157227 RepID=UPI003517D205